MADQYHVGIPLENGYSVGDTGGGGSYRVAGSGGYHVGIPLGGYTVAGAQPHPEHPQIANRFAGLDPNGDSSNILGAALRQTGDIITGLPSVATTIGAATWHDLRGEKSNDPRLDSFRYLFTHPVHYGELWLHDPKGFGGAVVTPQVTATKADVVAAKNRDWNYFEQHPLNPIIDAAAVLSVGGRAALAGGEGSIAARGLLGKTARHVATTEREITDGELTQTINQASTVQGRIRQRAFDKWSMENGDARVLGVGSRMTRILNRRVSNEMVRAHLPLRVFQSLTRQLTDAETFAFHVVVEPVTLDDRIKFFEAELERRRAIITKREKGWLKKPPKTRARRVPSLRPIEKYLDNLKSPAVRDAIEHPRQEFIDALDAGGQVEGEAGRRLMETGALHPDARAARVELPARVMEPPPPPPPPAPPTYVGPLLPPTVPHSGPITFAVRIPKLFYEAHAGKRGLIEESGRAPGDFGVSWIVGKRRGDILTVRMDEDALRHLIKDAGGKHPRGLSSSARATLNRLKAQEHIIHDARDKAFQRLQWRRRRTDGVWHVEDSDLHIQMGEHGYQAFHGDEPIGPATDIKLSDAKRRVERYVEFQRSEATRAEAVSKTAAETAATGVEDPFMAALDSGDVGTMAYAKLGPKEEPLRQAAQAGDTEVAASVSQKATPKTGEGIYSFTRRSTGKVEHEFRAKNYKDAKRQYREKTNTGSVSQRYMDIRVRPLEKTEAAMETSHIPALDALRQEAQDALGQYAPVSELDQQFANSAFEKMKNPQARLSGDEQRVVTEALDEYGARGEARGEAPPEAPAASVSQEMAPPTEEVPADAQSYDLPERNPAEMGRANVHGPMFPPHYRFPHYREAISPGAFLSPKVEAMLGKNRPLSQLRHNSAVLLTNALMITDPERVISRDYLSTMRHLMFDLMQRNFLDKIAREPRADLVESGFKPSNWWYYRPSYEHASTVPLTRDTALQESLTADRSVLDTTRAKEKLTEKASGVVAKSLEELKLPDGADLHDLETLKRLGVKIIPRAYGKDFRNEFGRTSAAIRYFYDRPMDVWRAITLNYRPAWIVNNFVGNGVMGLATYGPKGAAAYLRVLLATEHGDEKVLKLWRFTKKVPTLRRKYGRIFDELAPQLHSAGLFGTQTKITHGGVYEGRYAGVLDSKALRALNLTAGNVGRGVLHVGRGLTKLEILMAEDTGREAAFIRETVGDVKRIRETAKKMGEGNLELGEALKRMDQASVERAVERVNDALGDFNDLNAGERSIIRRFVPFYSWFKVITKVSAKYAARYPARVLLLKNISDARNRDGEMLLPPWLGGSILLGGQSKAGTQTLISTAGLNPYETIPQIASGGIGSVITPVGSSLFIGATGVDPAFGARKDYYGLGATTDASWKGQGQEFLGSLLQNLAPFSTAEKAHDYKGKLYRPRNYHAGPLTVNDFWLQYFGLPLRHVSTSEAQRERGLR